MDVPEPIRELIEKCQLILEKPENQKSGIPIKVSCDECGTAAKFRLMPNTSVELKIPCSCGDSLSGTLSWIVEKSERNDHQRLSWRPAKKL